MSARRKNGESAVRAGKRGSDLVLALGEGTELAQKREQKDEN
jgi:GTPase involved in cell partitioning and DNA repair